VGLRFTDDWYFGDTRDDLAEFLRAWGADGYPVDEVRYSTCVTCAGEVFQVESHLDDARVVRRTCRRCGRQQYIGDSEDYWDEERAYISVCFCEEEDFNVAVGFSLYQDGDGVRSLATAERCTACGRIASLTGWMIRTGDLRVLDQT
jgi:hypothetical protein